MARLASDSRDEKDDSVRPEHHHCDHDHDHNHDHDHDQPGSDIEFGLDADYHAHGVRFQHPGDWTVTEEVGPDETTISVQSSGTSFWSLTLIADAPDPADVVETVLDAYRSEYTDLDIYESAPQDGLVAAARDLEFVCLDVMNSATVVAFRTHRRTALVISQGTDREWEFTRPILESITDSFWCEEGLPGDDE